MVQICEFKEEACPVRRMLHPRGSPAGQGLRWDWLGDHFAEWIDYDMDTQTYIEAGWSNVYLKIFIPNYFIYNLFLLFTIFFYYLHRVFKH